MEKVGNYYVVFRPQGAVYFPATFLTKRRLLKNGPPKYLKDYINRKERYMGWVYLIHFDRPYKHAKHYIGFTKNVELRMLRHEAGRGSRLMQVITEAGIGWKIDRVWYADRYFERKLKNHSATRYCTTCGGREEENRRKREMRKNAKI